MTRPPADTVTFEAPAQASRCGRAGLGLLLRGSVGGNGVLIWLRPGDSLAPGDFPLLARADSSALRGATVAVRFMVGEAAYGLTLDSGSVAVTTVEPAIAASARGAGSDAAGAGRVALEASFESVALEVDTVSCQARP